MQITLFKRKSDRHCRLVEHSHDHLLSTEEGIADEFARAKRHRLLSVCHICWLYRLVSEHF